MSAAIGPPLAVARAERRAQHKNFIGYAAIIAFALLTLAAVAAHGGSILNLAFPLLATALGGALFIYCRNIYIAYTWWIWLFSPEVRRLVDFQTHFHTISPVMLSPLLVTSFALLAVAGRPRFLLHRSMLPFALIALVTLFAFITGVFISGFFGSAYEWGTWLEPLAFCVFLMMDSRAIQENRRALLSAIIIGLVIIGAYGIYQFFHLPPWDAAWLTNSRLRSEGAAYAEQVRVFGTLNDSGAFAFVLTGSLIFMLVARGPLRFVGGAVGFPSFLLAQERQSWGAWLIAAAFVFWRMGGKARLRVGLAATIIAAIATPILTVGPVATKLSARFASIQNVQTDYSGQVRAALYKNFLATALSQPIGNGFGALGIAAKLTVGQTVDFDSGLLELPFTFGWVGCLIFTWSVSRLALTILGRYLKTKDPITIAASGLFFGMLGVLIFAQVFTGAGGMVLWTAVALALTTPETLHNRRLGKI